MIHLSYKLIVVLCIICCFFMVRAHIEEHQVKKDTKLKQIFRHIHDSMLRGILMGLISSGFEMAINNAVTWSLIGVIVQGCGNMII